MTTYENGTLAGAERMSRMSELLKRYPNVSQDELAEAKAWFRREASALEVATLASREDISAGYTLFRKEHVDRFSPRDILTAGLFLLLAMGAIGLIVYLAS